MLVGVVSDTHGDCLATAQAVRVLEAAQVSSVIHCGDIGSASVVELFSPWPTHFVLGNTDWSDLLDGVIREAGQTCHQRFGSLELGEKRIAFLHGDDTRRLRETIESGRWDLVCHGHTHEFATSHQGPTLVVNPGAVTGREGAGLALVELPALSVRAVSL